MISDLINKVGAWGTAFAGVCGLCGVVAGAVSYGLTLKEDFEASKQHIKELASKVASLEDATQSAERAERKGLQGERGPAGPPGPPGPIGPQGAPGSSFGSSTPSAGLTEADVVKLIDSRLKALSSGRPLPMFSSSDASIDPSSCIDSDGLRQAKTVIVKEKMEFCNKDGELLTAVKEVSYNFGGNVQFFNPSSGDWGCFTGSECRFNWLRSRVFFVERVFEKDETKYALLRIKDAR